MPKTLSTPQVRFVLHCPKGREGKICPLYAVMQKSGIRYKIPTGEGVQEGKEWTAKSKESYRADLTKTKDVFRRAELERINRRLDEMQNTLRRVWDEKWEKGMSEAKFSHEFKKHVGIEETSKMPTLLEFAEKYVKERAEDKGENHPTVSSLRYGLNNLSAYSKRFGEVDFDGVDFEFLERFTKWLYLPCKYTNFQRKALNQGSAGQVVTAVKQFVTAARKKQYTTNSFVTERGFSVPKSPTNKPAFTIDDLVKIYNFDLSKLPTSKKLERTRALIFVGCFTGMRNSDWHKLKPELVEVHGGEKLLNVLAQKTSKPIGIPFLPLLEKILERNNWDLPDISTQRFNENVKELCKVVGIDRKVLTLNSTGGKQTSKEEYFYEVVSSHACRRCFISTMLLLGVSATQIMPITGHTTEAQMRAYAAIENRQNAASISRAFRGEMTSFLGIPTDFFEKMQG